MIEYVSDETAVDRLYLKGLAIRYERGRRQPGLWMPIMWHLALRGHTGGMIELADWFSYGGKAKHFGKPSDAFCAAGLYRRAWRTGDARAACNAAVSCFNRNDMSGYRYWLRHAAKAGEVGAGRELKGFETRLPHSAAAEIRRLRPRQKRDAFY